MVVSFLQTGKVRRSRSGDAESRFLLWTCYIEMSARHQVVIRIHEAIYREHIVDV